ncbi:MAG: lysophospholipid acyltransferase family protein [Nitrospirota bacterium]
MKVNESISRDILRLLIWFPFRWLTSVIPLNWLFYLFKSMGDMHFYLSKGKKNNISKNLKRLLGVDNNAAMHIVKKNFENHYTDRLHIFLYPRLTSRERIEKYVYFENLEVLDVELKKGKGVLLVQPHFGPVQITLLALALYGYKPVQIGYPSDRGLSRIGKSVAYKYRIKYEAMLPAPILPADGYLGKVYKYLVNGGVVLTTGDGAGGGVFLGKHRRFNFLGAERLFPLGPAAWAIKTKSAFIPTFIIYEIHNRFRIVFERPIEGVCSDIEKDEAHITEQFISITEEYIKKYPYCWHFWDEVGKI